MKVFSLLLLCSVVLLACERQDRKMSDGSGNERSISGTESSSNVDNKDNVPGQHSSDASKEVSGESVEDEKVGPLYLGQAASDVVEKVGEPENTTEMQVWGVDGMERQTWKYLSQGISLTMLNDPEQGLVTDQINLTQKATLKTERGIGVGSSREDVVNAYADNLASGYEGAGDESVVVGSIYGGIVFTFKENRVTEMFVGAAAE